MHLARMQTSVADIASTLAIEYGGDAAVVAGYLCQEEFAALLDRHRAYGQVQIRERVFAGMEEAGRHGNDVATWLATQYLELSRDPTDKRLSAIITKLEKLRKTDPRAFAKIGESALRPPSTPDTPQ